MKKNIFAVCDLEVDYALNFMDYLNQKKNIPFEIQAFTTVESLIACAVRCRSWKLVRLLYFRRECTHQNWTDIQVYTSIRHHQMW